MVICLERGAYNNNNNNNNNAYDLNMFQLMPLSPHYLLLQ